MDYTIAQDFVLASKGLIYSKSVNPNIKLRSMTTIEEMKRLAYSDTPYKTLAEIIDDCMVTKPGISSYDMCIGDYQFLLHRLRMVTYGKDYNTQAICPYCGTKINSVINLEDLSVIEWDENADIASLLEFKLPVTGKNIKIRIQTPHMTDDMMLRKKDIQKRFPDMQGDVSILLLVSSLIETVDGQVLDAVKLETFVKNLPMRDTNTIIKKADKVNMMIGIDTTIHNTCTNSACGKSFDSSFRLTSEFFGPSVD